MLSASSITIPSSTFVPESDAIPNPFGIFTTFSKSSFSGVVSSFDSATTVPPLAGFASAIVVGVVSSPPPGVCPPPVTVPSNA